MTNKSKVSGELRGHMRSEHQIPLQENSRRGSHSIIPSQNLSLYICRCTHCLDAVERKLEEAMGRMLTRDKPCRRLAAQTDVIAVTTMTGQPCMALLDGISVPDVGSWIYKLSASAVRV